MQDERERERRGEEERIEESRRRSRGREREREREQQHRCGGDGRTQQRFLEFFDAHCVYCSSLLLFFSSCYAGCKQYIDILGGKSPGTGHWHEINVTETNSYMDYQ